MEKMFLKQNFYFRMCRNCTIDLKSLYHATQKTVNLLNENSKIIIIISRSQNKKLFINKKECSQNDPKNIYFDQNNIF